LFLWLQLLVSHSLQVHAWMCMCVNSFKRSTCYFHLLKCSKPSALQ
jgi:hypothetical protein